MSCCGSFSNSHSVTTQMSLGSESASKYVFVVTYLALLWGVDWPLSISYSNHSKELSSPPPSDGHIHGRETWYRSTPSNFLPTWDTQHILHVLRFLCRYMRNLGFFSRTLLPGLAIWVLSCVQLCNPMDCSLLGFSVHGIFQQEYWSGLPFPSPALGSPCLSK